MVQVETPARGARTRAATYVAALLATLALAVGATQAVAEPSKLDEDKLQLDIPTGWALVQLVKDEEASVYGIDGAGAPIEMYALRLDLPALGDKAGKAHGELLLRRFLDVEKALELKPRGSTRLSLAGCTARSYAYKEGAMEVRLVVCLHPDDSRAYVWRVAYAAKEADAVQAVMQRFNAFLLNHVALLDAGGSPLPREEAAALGRDAAAGQDAPIAP